ncbi:uncharacterized protein PV07_06274 [Cladophialophora immunda]|uniref:Metallo-beta-lactamase domain-containing protein n=1 Tax=Cladophialophora immunda TaxID=569365 RepID=A0A0D2CKH6_9EURO|nr:uncharacterized protein PV07_06274 [Cladophialophora immunda]KIW30535.1 hypothetical protein PV07_06274 [Cladophialophora immunda]OQU97192.1 hypothetical protein CLAIMM_03166 [Cladophialophora immunda]
MSSSEEEPLVAAIQAPLLNIPSGATVSVKIIDATTTIKVPLSLQMGPKIIGHDNLFCPAYSFLVEHPSGRKLLYDLGTRKDLENLSPSIVSMMSAPGWDFKVEKDVAEILEANGVSTESIEAVIWSHWHFDHIGNMETFPSSVNLIVGPGFKSGLLPGYPTNKDSHLLESDWAGRELVELEFDTRLKLGQFRAIDYFDDGSFYLLDAPGHAIGHICGLARVSKGTGGEEDTFVFMGGDTCHHGGQWRPNQYLPLPKQVFPTKPILGRSVCPGSVFQKLHRHNSAVEEYYKMAPNFPQDYQEAEKTIHHMQEFDAAKNILVIIAHDCAPLEPSSGFKFFPNGTLNDWKKDKLDQRIRWAFLEDFQSAIEQGAQQETKMEAGLTFRPQ